MYFQEEKQEVDALGNILSLLSLCFPRNCRTGLPWIQTSFADNLVMITCVINDYCLENEPLDLYYL